MTMLAHTLKNILDYIPEALPLVKQASVDKEFPIDSKSSTIASALQLKYFEKVAYQAVDITDIEKVAGAVKLYNVEKETNQLSDSMIKAANAKCLSDDSNSMGSYLLKVSSFDGYHSDLSIEDRSSTAIDLYKEAKDRNLVPSDEVTLYSGNAFLSKEAAVKSLSVRFDSTKNQDFIKIAQAIGRGDNITSETMVAISDTICEMDKIAGLNFKGHNFYKEAFFVKEAAFKGSITVKLDGKQVPYESIERVGKDNISNYLGADIAKEMDSGPMNFKNVVETLPLDLQRVLSSLIKNV